MKTDEGKLQEIGVPHLRVFSGEGDDEVGGLFPSDSAHQAREEWMKREAYWAGRNRAERLSARLVA